MSRRHHHKKHLKLHEPHAPSVKEALRQKAEELRHEAREEFRAAKVLAHENHKSTRHARHRYHQELHSVSVMLHEDEGGI